MIWTFLKNNFKIVIIAVLLVLFYVDHVRLTAKAAAAQKVLTTASTAAATTQGGSTVTVSTNAAVDASVAAALKPFVAALKAADKKNKVESTSRSTVQIADVVSPSSVISPAGPGNPNPFPGSDGSFWRDEYHRYSLNLHTGLMDRKQQIEIEGAVVRGVDAKYRWTKFDVFEKDPVTGATIPDTGLTVHGDYQFGDEAAAAVSPLHPRAVAAIDFGARPGVGVEFLNGEKYSSGIVNKLNLSALGYYDRGSKVGIGALQLGYRFLGNASAGPYIGIRTDGTKVYGLGLTLEVTR